MIIFDSKQNRPNLLRYFGRLFDVIFQWIVLYMKKLTIHHYGWVTIPSTVYSVKNVTIAFLGHGVVGLTFSPVT